MNRIIMPVPFLAMMDTSMELNGLSLVNHMIEILINERLYRDLKDAEVVNSEVTRPNQLVIDGVLSAEQAKAARKVLHIYTVEIMEIRPDVRAPGTSFSGFFSRRERLELIEAGRPAGGSNRIAILDWKESGSGGAELATHSNGAKPGLTHSA